MATAKRGPGRPRKSEGVSALAIKQSAVHVFADKGFDAANLREIAAHAGVDMALISYQFDSKLELWKTIITDVGTQIEAALAALAGEAESGDSQTALRVAMAYFIDFVCTHRVFARFLLRDTGHAPDRAEWVYARITRPLLDHFLPLMESARAAGQLHARYPEMVFLEFAYCVAGSVIRRELFIRLIPQLADDDAFRAALHETLIDPVFRHG